MNACQGFYRDWDGQRQCPLDYQPHDDETWADMCERCRDGAADHQELLSDMARDEE